MSRRDGRWKWVTKKSTGSFTLGAMSWGIIMTRRQKCLLDPVYRTAQRHRPKSYRAGHWYRQGNSQQQLLYHGDIAPSVNSAAIFDAPTPCCGVNYRCRAAPSVNVALEIKFMSTPVMIVNIGSGNGLVPTGNKSLLSQCWPRSMSPYGVSRPQWANSSLAPEKCVGYFKCDTFKLIFGIDIRTANCCHEIALRWIPQHCSVYAFVVLGNKP